jgi:hypothetical protein
LIDNLIQQAWKKVDNFLYLVKTDHTIHPKLLLSCYRCQFYFQKKVPNIISNMVDNESYSTKSGTPGTPAKQKSCKLSRKIPHRLLLDQIQLLVKRCMVHHPSMHAIRQMDFLQVLQLSKFQILPFDKQIMNSCMSIQGSSLILPKYFSHNNILFFFATQVCCSILYSNGIQPCCSKWTIYKLQQTIQMVFHSYV